MMMMMVYRGRGDRDVYSQRQRAATHTYTHIQYTTSQPPPQSVVRHLGRSANSGHYITDVRDVSPPSAAGGKPRVTWRRHDDSVVSHVRSSGEGRWCVCVCARSRDAYLRRYAYRMFTPTQLADGDRVLEDDRSLQTGYIFVYCAVPPS